MKSETKFKETEIGKIPESWEIKSISDVSEIYLGGTPMTTVKEYWNGDIKWASAKDLASCSSRYIHETERKITQKGLENSAAKILPKNTLVITSRGTVGKIALLPEPMSFNQTCYGLKARKEVSPLYLYYKLKDSVARFESVSYGTVFETITIRTFEELKISIPAFSEQLNIIKILSDLDSNIELNNEMNKTLEAIGQTLFKHWFVDFEFPNDQGKPYKSSGGEMVDSELGDIPEGWEVGKISYLIKILSGFAFKSSHFVENGEYHLVTIKNVQDGYLDLSKTSFLNYLPEGMPNYCLLESGDILLSLTGNVGRCCLVNDENLLLNQRVAKLQAKNTRDSAYTYTLFRQQTMKRTLENAAKGTAQANLSPIETASMEIQVPPNELLETFSKRATPLLEKVLKNKSKIRTLENMRDTLLPKLMSGAVRVRL